MGLVNFMKYLFYNLFSSHNSITKDFKENAYISPEMAEAFKNWDEAYRKDTGMQFGAIIASEAARLSTQEFEINVLGNTTKSDVIRFIVNHELCNSLRKQVEYGCAYGSLLIKPNFDGNKISIDFIKPNCFIPIAFDNDGELSSVICLERKTIGKYIYTRAEKCTYKDNVYMVETKVYMSSNYNDIGVEIPITDVEDWKRLKTKVIVKNVNRPLFGLFKYPSANNIDIDSPLGVSILRRSCDTIDKLDDAYAKFNLDIDTSDKVVFVADYLLTKSQPGEKPVKNNPWPNLVRGLNFTTNGTEIKEFIPVIRDREYKNALQMYIDTIALQCGFDAGYFSFDTSSGGIKTATEVKIDQQRTLSTITDIQKELKNTIEDVIYSINVLLDLYDIAEGNVKYIIKYKDFNIDPEEERNRMLNLIEKGIMPKWKYLVQFEGMTEEQAKKLIEEI